MMKKEIKLSEWERILFGDAPAAYMVEVLFRTIIIYLLLLVVVKLLGKRMSGRLTITEWAVMLTLGALISLPIQAPERGLLQGVVLLLFVFVLERVQMAWSFHNRKVEKVILGEMTMLVKDGVIQKRQMDKNRLSREQLCAVLRGDKIYNLGVVQRVYQEATGNFSIYKFKEPRPGLTIMPADDASVEHMLRPAPEQKAVCGSCGQVSDQAVIDGETTCFNCGGTGWMKTTIQQS